MSDPAITVLIPTTGNVQFLRQSVESVLRQEDVDLELVVIDDGSTTDVGAALAEFGDPRIRVLRNPRRQGVARSRNRGIAEARAPWIAFLDDDDIWAPPKLRLQLEAAESRGASFVYTSAVIPDRVSGAITHRRAADPLTLTAALRQGNAIHTPSAVLATTDAVKVAGGFDERLSVLADWDLWLMIAYRSAAARCDEPLVAYIRHEDNMHRTVGTKAMLREFRYLRWKHEQMRPDLPPFNRAVFVHWIAESYRDANRGLAAAAMYSRLALRHRRPRALLTAAGSIIGDGGRAMIGRGAPARAAVPEWFLGSTNGATGASGGSNRSSVDVAAPDPRRVELPSA